MAILRTMLMMFIFSQYSELLRYALMNVVILVVSFEYPEKTNKPRNEWVS